MDSWHLLLDILILLGGALVLGVVCERLRQSPILGYLAAGTLLGPNALWVVSTADEVAVLAELGVALLLFTIGLEFSWPRLKKLGAAAFGGGTGQVLVTMGLAAGCAMIFSMPFRTSVAVGAIVDLTRGDRECSWTARAGNPADAGRRGGAFGFAGHGDRW